VFHRKICTDALDVCAVPLHRWTTGTWCLRPDQITVCCSGTECQSSTESQAPMSEIRELFRAFFVGGNAQRLLVVVVEVRRISGTFALRHKRSLDLIQRTTVSVNFSHFVSKTTYSAPSAMLNPLVADVISHTYARRN